MKNLQARVSKIMLCGISAFALIGCGAELPNLVPKEIFFDDDNILSFIFANEGEGVVPADIGAVSMYVDGMGVGSYGFTDLADQSFRDPGGELTIRSNFRMSGTDRRIGIFVDPQNVIYESNEFQNTLSRTLTPPDITGPDFIISRLSTGTGGELGITIKNNGNADSPTDLRVRIRVIVNETVAADLTPVLPLLIPGGIHSFTPSPAIIISDGDEVRVLLNTNHLLDEIDNTNNVREEVLPEGPPLDAYLSLLALPKIKNNMIWEDDHGVNDYDSWTTGQKMALAHAIRQREIGTPYALTAPPALLTEDNLFAPMDAWLIYLDHVVHSLWIEVHGKTPWHLTDFTDDQLVYLLDSRKLMRYDSASNRYGFLFRLMGNVTPWNPRICYEFLSNFNIIKPTQLNTIYSLADWMRGHLIHTSLSDEYIDLYGYAGPPAVDKVLYPLEGKRHKTAGCWGTTGLWAALLRGINIPVENDTTIFDGSPHSRPAFPSVDKSMPHGDDPYRTLFTPSGNIIPSSEIFYTYAEMNRLFISPALDCYAGDCNTIGDQAAYNSEKDQWRKCYDALSDFILYTYARDGEEYLDGSLRGPRIGGEVVEFVFPYFTEVQREAMIDAVISKVTSIGEGDINAGKRIVIERYHRFGSNK